MKQEKWSNMRKSNSKELREGLRERGRWSVGSDGSSEDELTKEQIEEKRAQKIRKLMRNVLVELQERHDIYGNSEESESSSESSYFRSESSGTGSTNILFYNDEEIKEAKKELEELNKLFAVGAELSGDGGERSGSHEVAPPINPKNSAANAELVLSKGYFVNEV